MTPSPDDLDASPSAAARAHRGRRWAAVEIVWIFLIFFLAAGSPPPDAGESHYMVKARHYWEPTWCAGDLFLESRDAHLTFNWTIGWLTKYVSLDGATWIARVTAWVALAVAWRRLSWAIVPMPLASLLTLGLMLLLARHFHLARELVLRGGVEAKTFAYVFVFLALGSIARNQWRAALLLAGAGAAFHVLVGGWTVVAIGMAWVMGRVAERWTRAANATAPSPGLRDHAYGAVPASPEGRGGRSGEARSVSEGMPGVWSLVPAAVGGFVLSLPGLVPSLALMAGVDPQVAREACRVYVFERLSHHLVFHSFEPWFIARYGVLLAAGFILFWIFRKQPGLWRVNLVVTGAVGISLVGIALDQWFVLQANVLRLSEAEYQAAAGPLLRYYWFRLADVLVPASVALGGVYGLHALSTSRPQLASWLLIAAILAAGGDLAAVCARRAMLRVPGAIVQQHPTLDTRRPWWHVDGTERHRGRSLQVSATDHTGELNAREWLAQWQAVCGWIAESTPAEAKFLTPRQQQTFKWYAGRAEVATWKDIPQDAAGMMAWKAAFDEIHPSTSDHRRHDLAAFSDQELVALAHKYGCQYVVIDRTRSSRPLGLVRVYPLFVEENPAFEVYQVAQGKPH